MSRIHLTFAWAALLLSGCFGVPPPPPDDADGGDAGSADGGCAASADDPCAVQCFTLSFTAVGCGAGVVPGAVQPVSMYVPAGWQKSGGSALENDHTTAFDVATCRFTVTVPACNSGWLFDLKAPSCTISSFGTSGGLCTFYCPQPCTLTRP